jgi:hypothetical protein
MTAPCDPEDASKARDEEHEIVLRLGDILPRVPPDLLKPGSHDTTQTVRFTIEELAEKIARGRVTVPLERLSSAFPGVFRDNHTSIRETEVPLPLQRLLDQLGLVARKTAATASVPSEQVAQARAEAGRIIEANAMRPVPEFATAPSVHAVRIAKAIYTARQVFGLFPKPGEQMPEATHQESIANESTKEPGKDISAAAAISVPESAPVEALQASTPTPEPAAVTGATISLRILPIFRLLPAAILKSPPPDSSARVSLPLAAIEPQLAEGHVEIPLEDFVKALPDALRPGILMAPGTQVWIPLDEIFQNLPTGHPFHMPPLDPEPSPEVPAGESPPEVPLEKKEEPPTPPEAAPEPAAPREPASAKLETPAAEPSAAPADAPSEREQQPVSEVTAPSVPERSEKEPEPAEAQIPPPAAETTPAPVPTSDPVVAPASKAAPAPEPAPAPAETTDPVPAASPEPAPVTEPAPPIAELPPAPEPAPAPSEITESVPAASPEPAPVTEPAPPIAEVPAAPEPAPAPLPGLAPWMHGFQRPPPRVFATASEPATASAEATPIPPVETAPLPPPAPEAKRTADFLAGQPGIVAAAVFVEGTVFASEDFPGKPDLDTLRDFMGAFIGIAEAGGPGLGWNRTLTMACEQFHLTAIVRERRFIVALHHDRLLPPGGYDALVLAADDLGKASDVTT